MMTAYGEVEVAVEAMKAWCTLILQAYQPRSSSKFLLKEDLKNEN